MRRYILALTDSISNIITFLLGLRILLKLLGARTTAPFVTWVYETTRPLLTPFEGMFPTSNLGDGFVLEISALFAVVFYTFLGFLLQLIVSNLLRFEQASSANGEGSSVRTTAAKKR